jgi:hypothetical protein
MPISLPLSEMTVAGKLQIIEEIWEDLSRNADELESPDWHGEILVERERQIASGEARFIDWKKRRRTFGNGVVSVEQARRGSI